jgi:DNA-binding winged helix-turn-helix (wHTH) protein
MRVTFDRFTFDATTRELLERDARVHLSPKAFDLLQLLLTRRPAVVGKADIFEHVWRDTFVSDANLSVAIAEIRQALGEDTRQPRFVRTVHRIGYAFCGDAVDAPAASPTPGDAPVCWLVRDDRPVPLAAGSHVIGRDPRSAVWIDASGVSRRHARIDVEASGATLIDLESSNGTFVDGQRLGGMHHLRDGERIELGAASLTFRTWSDAAAARTERVERGRARS